ncbi:MAG: NAD(P)H-dependent oxidoreductase subunit E [Clostridia bacterium]
MSSKVIQGDFLETAEQAKRLQAVLDKYAGIKDSAVAVLEEVQVIYGYLPKQVLTRVSKAINRSEEELYGIGTFYSQFSLFPKGKYNFAVCLGTACYVNDAKAVLDRLITVLGISEGECTDDGKFSITVMRCVGCCGLAPVLTVNEDVYGKMTPKLVDEIVDKYRNL